MTKAEELAQQNYLALVFLDPPVGEATTPCYVAVNLDLEGCTSQGATPAEALANLDLARIDYIQSLLEDGLEVPPPAQVGNVFSINLANFITPLTSPDPHA